MADPYSLLGVPRSADEAAIKSAYRKLAKELHPDRNKDNPKAAEKFSEVTRAYDLLSDKDKRARFDRGEIDADGNPTHPFGFGGQGGGRSQGGGPEGFEFGAGGADFSDIFEGLFSGGRGRPGGGFGFGGRGAPPPQRGANMAYRLSVPFVDAATLAPQRITLADGKTIDLKLPAGVENGTQMKLSGKGQPGPAGAGDAIVTIEIGDHAFYKRDGDNVRLDLPISLNEAVAGARVKVPTVDGPVMLAVPAGAHSGQTLRLKGKGFHRKSGGRGDQLVTLMIDVPGHDAALKAFVESWSDTRPLRTHLGV
ncbi:MULTISPECIES: DnaJ C-terminal domain-containing protein [unclassified Sphingobium]|uniref:DnaJ C-terminal domain-containing protein n=1 Tax=unclassified Sphingobium TaxID=2611147 RepID=UPI00222404FF|nr:MULTISPECIES: DnaJ C-terminal domain-containing protein [unclassified Sphingobium]MCW2396005.1 DnaJ-class molecular chaperone [Sphingobium sp. B8D3B]MCW2419521.1 DnaJ-class molecular chaperone [Sphingobium sp. B8D3C]